jgi:hypothetical protein
MEVSSLIAALGGPTRVAKTLGITTQAVSNWSATRRVPREHHVAVWRMASAAGLDWTPPGAEGLTLVEKERAA